MSITDDKRSKTRRDAAAGDPSTGTPRSRRPIMIGAIGACALAVVAVGTFVVVKSDDSSTIKAPPVGSPLTMPATMDGLAAAPKDADFTSSPIWQSKAKAAAPGHVVVGRAYGSAQLRRQIRAVAGRADLTGKLEFAWAADKGKLVHSDQGDAHCTNNLILAAGSKASVRPTMMLCWRTSAKLSAYGVVIDFDHHPTSVDGMKVLDTTWKAALTGH